MRIDRRTALIAGWLLALLCMGSRAEAGQLVLRNTSDQAIDCTVDGWTVASGGRSDWTIRVDPGATYYVGQNAGRAQAVIGWASCAGLTTRAMNITPAGPNGTLVLNGHQNRVLNVSLFSFIPNPVGATFEPLLAHVIDTFQQAHPQVLLNVQMNPVAQSVKPTKIYDFANLSAQLGAGGFDVMEIDTIYLGFLATNQFINEVNLQNNQWPGDAPLPVARQAATLRDQNGNDHVWGIPSWLCLDFVYSRDQGIENVTTLAQLLQFLQNGQVQPRMIGDYNGSWRLPSLYITSYVHSYGIGQIAQAMVMPPDQNVIQNIAAVTANCVNNVANICIDNTFHNSTTPGRVEQAFVHGQAGAGMGFSEQSFYINSYAQPGNLYVAPAVWGNQQQPAPLLFSDAFVTSYQNCRVNPCAADAAAFMTLMTGEAMKAYIVESQDLPNGSPWRTLLVATQPFYQRDEVVNNQLYQRYAAVLQNQHVAPFPNTFTANLQTQMSQAICQQLRQAQPNYDC